MNNLNPQWPRVSIPIVSLCNGDYDRPIKIEIWDEDSDGKHGFMGSFESSVRGLLTSGGAPFDVIEKEVQKKKKSYVNSGTFSVQNAIIEHHPTLTDVSELGLSVSAIAFSRLTHNAMQLDCD